MKLTRQQRITLAVLRESGASGATAAHFHNAGVGRHSARIAELRKMGFDIEHRSKGHRHFLRHDPCIPVEVATAENAGQGGGDLDRLFDLPKPKHDTWEKAA